MINPTTRSLLIEPRLGSVTRLEIDKAKLLAWRNKMDDCPGITWISKAEALEIYPPINKEKR